MYIFSKWSGDVFVSGDAWAGQKRALYPVDLEFQAFMNPCCGVWDLNCPL